MIAMQITIVAILFIGLQVSAIPEGGHHMPPQFVLDCAKNTGFKLPEMGAGKPSTPPEVTPEMLCFTKCLGENSGVITSAGDIDMGKLDDAPMHMRQEKKDEFKTCISKVTKVEKCEDMREFAECMRAFRMPK